MTRPLTMASIEEYLKDFGLEPEFGTHSNIRGLSGGQKVSGWVGEEAMGRSCWSGELRQGRDQGLTLLSLLAAACYRFKCASWMNAV